ncbi:MAG: sigma-70 family RNA polymerase sigma factor [Deltaproteobacteria bacterium]|nr:sigma-70 family RNA polymerase sigma factor [Deltaproteobacteria bacterium]MCB9788394.1 sigma-70 family RNA polymerase sigma factor [Deltaproteobacteria bacterium]
MSQRPTKQRAPRSSGGVSPDPASGDDRDDDSEPADADLESLLTLDEDADEDEDEDDDEASDGPVIEVSSATHLPVVRARRLPERMNALNVYLARLQDVEILPIEEQTRLAERYQRDGDAEAAARLVASNLRLVVKIAFQFRRQWADVMDLVSEGNVGLAEAIRKFDADRGVPFPSYARFWIRARILAFIQENKHLVHAGSRAARKLFWRLDRERRQLQQEGLEATPKLLAERVGVQPEDVTELAPILDQRMVSFDVPIYGDEEGRTRGDNYAGDTFEDPETAARGGEVQQALQEAFTRFRELLDERERAIWDERLQSEDPIRLEDLGNRFGVSKERVRQLEVRIKTRLKTFLENELDDDVIVEMLH